MKDRQLPFLITLCVLTGAVIFFVIQLSAAVDSPVVPGAVEGHVCRPEGKGPFPAVVYNPGRDMEGNGPKKMAQLMAQGEYYAAKTCRALAADGFLALVPIRHSPEPDWMAAKDEVARAVDYVKTLPGVDSSRIALMGFSRGGFLTLMVGVERADLRAFIIMAPGGPKRLLDEVQRSLRALSAPVLLLIEAADEAFRHGYVDMLERSLRGRGKEVRTVRYDRGGGHYLFADMGYYWDDVRAFLREKLAAKPAENAR